MQVLVQSFRQGQAPVREPARAASSCPGSRRAAAWARTGWRQPGARAPRLVQDEQPGVGQLGDDGPGVVDPDAGDRGRRRTPEPGGEHAGQGVQLAARASRRATAASSAAPRRRRPAPTGARRPARADESDASRAASAASGSTRRGGHDLDGQRQAVERPHDGPRGASPSSPATGLPSSSRRRASSSPAGDAAPPPPGAPSAGTASGPSTTTASPATPQRHLAGGEHPRPGRPGAAPARPAPPPAPRARSCPGRPARAVGPAPPPPGQRGSRRPAGSCPPGGAGRPGRRPPRPRPTSPSPARARSTTTTPSANVACWSAPTSTARVVLPTPPGPTTVTRRGRASRRITAARSPSRPTSPVSGAGASRARLPAGGVEHGSWSRIAVSNRWSSGPGSRPVRSTRSRPAGRPAARRPGGRPGQGGHEQRPAPLPQRLGVDQAGQQRPGPGRGRPPR